MNFLEIKKTATAGTAESSDIMVIIKKNEQEGNSISLQSSVEKQFGAQIRATIEAVLEKFDIHNAQIQAIDQGALDCTIQARMTTAVLRACELSTLDLGEL